MVLISFNSFLTSFQPGKSIIYNFILYLDSLSTSDNEQFSWDGGLYGSVTGMRNHTE